ncbi:hypothetical protein [Gryllotalpicola koreensis]|uniref:Rubredoxin n=1 Tax=Gryllotalpicola koreensis TaxID=993086 RepID=A0ABP8A2V6_9MICO
MSTSGAQVKDVWIYVECDCDPANGREHTCDWHGGVDATIDPEDPLNGMDAVWKCPACGCEHEEPEGTW